MGDVFSTRKRSEIMSRVRSRGNKATELALIKLFRTCNVTGWRRHRQVFGSPDFVFPRRRLAVFADGCFWHSCPKNATLPATHKRFWSAKLARNKTRDRLVTRTLKRNGWRVLRIWQHDLRRRNQASAIRRLQEALMP